MEPAKRTEQCPCDCTQWPFIRGRTRMLVSVQEGSNTDLTMISSFSASLRVAGSG